MRSRLTLTLFLILLTACEAFPAQVQTPAATPTALILVTVPPDATATPTPFQPLVDSVPMPVIATPPAARWGTYPPPSIYPVSIQIPPPVGLLPQPAKQINILLLGSDQRPNDGGFRTDAMILVTINFDLGTVNLTSFPRDLFVYIPGWTMQRLNTAQAHGGFALTALTFEYNFGVRPNRYILINFSNFIAIVDGLGGIEVNVAKPLTAKRDGYGAFYTIPAGKVHMDGATALWYVRSRSSSNDIDRLRRAQEALLGIVNRLLSLNALARAPEFYDLYRRSVTTDLSLDDVLILLPLLNQLSDPSRINRYTIGYDQAYDWMEPYSAAQVLLPKPEALMALMRQALNIP